MDFLSHITKPKLLPPDTFSIGSKYTENAIAAGAPPQNPLGELTAFSRLSSQI